MKPREYSYLDAGFDSFLTRSIDSSAQVTLDSPGPPNTAIRLDGAQFSGAISDTLRIGNLSLNGVPGNIMANDGSNDFFILGDE